MGTLTETMQEILAAEEAEKAAERQAIDAAFPQPQPHILRLSKAELSQDEHIAAVLVDVPDSLKRQR